MGSEYAVAEVKPAVGLFIFVWTWAGAMEQPAHSDHDNPVLQIIRIRHYKNV